MTILIAYCSLLFTSNTHKLFEEFERSRNSNFFPAERSLELSSQTNKKKKRKKEEKRKKKKKKLFPINVARIPL